MYHEEQIKTALELYHQCESVTKTIRLLGYPSRRALHGWINDEGKPKKPRKKLQLIHTKEHPLKVYSSFCKCLTSVSSITNKVATTCHADPPPMPF